MSTEYLCRYSVASADMYYSEEGMRDVFLATDDRGNLQIWAQMVGEDTSSAINLCELFLEYAMYCSTWCQPDEDFCRMQDFAEQIGRAFGEFLEENGCLLKWDNSIDCALEHLFQTMNARVSIQYSGATEHLTVVDCPLESAAEHSGLRNIELAHHGINVMCRSMIQAVNPNVTLKTSAEIHPEFDFTILKPELA